MHHFKLKKRMSAGPATNTVTIGVVKKMLGTRSLSVYLSSIVLGSLLFGFGLDYIFSVSQMDPRSLGSMDEEAGVIAVGSSLVLWCFVLFFLLRPYFGK